MTTRARIDLGSKHLTRAVSQITRIVIHISTFDARGANLYVILCFNRFFFFRLSEFFYLLLGGARFRGRCWAAIRLSVSSSRTVRPCSPWGGRWIGLLRTTWSTICSSAPHSQASEEAIPHLYNQDRRCPTPVRRRLSRTQALLGRVILGVCVPVSGIKVRSLVGLSAHYAFHWWSARCAAHMLLLSEKPMSCCAAGTNGCLDLRRRATALDWRVSAEWSRCPGSMTRRPR